MLILLGKEPKGNSTSAVVFFNSLQLDAIAQFHSNSLSAGPAAAAGSTLAAVRDCSTVWRALCAGGDLRL